MTKQKPFILWFDRITMKDVPLVGGKNASLGEMIKYLSPKGVNVPYGFAMTSEAYRYFIKETGLEELIRTTLKNVDVKNIKDLAKRGKIIRDAFLTKEIPEDLRKELVAAYRKLGRKFKEPNISVAVRSSATAEDAPTASFAGQMETYLNVRGEEELLKSIRLSMQSLFTDRAIFYREQMKFDHLKIALSSGVQQMVRSDLAAAGVMFSIDTETGFPDVVLINGSWGLGENVVKGRVTPDQYYVFETTLKKGFKPVIGKVLGAKESKLIYGKGNVLTKDVPTSAPERQKFVLTDAEILTLAKWSVLIEKHYGRPMDSEWAKDGLTGKLYMVQARPETVESRKAVGMLEEYEIDRSKKPTTLVSGLSVGAKIGQGKAHVIKSVKEITEFKEGEVLVTRMTDPDWVPAMKLASAIVTDAGGRTAHAAIVSRELGIPCVVGTGNATAVIKSGEPVTVDCSGGETGRVYQGLVPFKIKRIDVSKIRKPKTKIMMNVGEPGQAFGLSFLPNDGVGLCREEFIIASDIGIHPMALINYENLKKSADPKIKVIVKKIDQKTIAWPDKPQFYIDNLAFGIGKIAAAFYPKEVIVRFSDFKTNEYRSLVGGELYEPKEENPMIGWRGASRYYHPNFAQAFALEVKAIKKVREEMGLVNVSVMVPFCRTVDEGRKVVKLIQQNGLRRGKFLGNPGVKIYVMCEIPSNALLADDFLKVFDGMSIGSNDLTQLTVGIDRDAGELLRGIANENDESVKILIDHVIRRCNILHKYIGICGQAPSDFPEFALFLVKQGIQSISLNPDSVLKTMAKINAFERKRK
ncbi:MAG: phosphoenolpyruvate synthase [Patescibacteria group bacterium]|nr:phosphoenolpyruvate synthase [Patescibacteria group bacterium]MCL5261929.1 phosphoenolpyruvate synthase [Patescibacteria group bacterium]